MQAGPKTPDPADRASGQGAAVSDIEVYFVDLLRARAVLEAEEARVPRLSIADRDRASAMANAEARHLWRSSRVATRIIIERFGGASLRGVPFQIEAGGRPYLGAGGPHFSVSHTDGVALVAIAKDMAVGVDLEAKTRSLRMSTERRQRIIAAAERAASQAALRAENDGDVLIAWVQLEAVAKALGIGIGRLLTEEGVVGGPRSNADRRSRPLEVRALVLEASDYIGAIAAKRLPADLTVKPFPYQNLDAFLLGHSS